MNENALIRQVSRRLTMLYFPGCVTELFLLLLFLLALTSRRPAGLPALSLTRSSLVLEKKGRVVNPSTLWNFNAGMKKTGTSVDSMCFYSCACEPRQ